MSEKVRKRILIFTSLLLSLLFVAFSFFTVFYFYTLRSSGGELDETLFSLSKGSNATKYYYNCSKTGSVYTPAEAERVFHLSDKKIWYSYGDFSPLMKKALIAVEDRRFFDHHGVDIKRTALAAINSLFHIKGKFGASTVTQQVIKNISGEREVSFKRKLKEIVRAYRLESRHSKEEILELYLNVVPMGEGIVGVGLGAENYFGKEPSELSVAEVATLIGIINAPTRYNPHENPEVCLRKRNEVLTVMEELGVITDSEYGSAIAEELCVKEKSVSNERISSWFAQTVNEDVIEALVSEKGITRELAERMVYSGGLSIYTTMDPNVQDILEEYYEKKENFPVNTKDGLDSAMVIYDAESGDLLGIVGSVGKKQAEHLLNLATVPHTPGSALKPIALYAPLINGGRINCATVFDDVPVVFKKSADTYIEYPKNYPNVYSGLTTVKDAIRLSKNTVAVRLYNMLGAEAIYNSLKNDFNFNTLVRRGLGDDGEVISDLASSPLALGQLSYGVSLRALTEAYSVFTGEGVYRKGRSFVAVYDSEGRLLLENKVKEKRVFRKETARIMNELLSGVVENGTASSITLKRLVDTAGKTGTSGDDKDRLFIGYTPYYTAGVWYGYRDSSKSLGALSKSHLAVWDEVMTRVHEYKLGGLSDEEIKGFSTAGLKRCEFCKDSGQSLSDACALDLRGERVDFGYFEPSNMPRGECKSHFVCLYDRENKCPAYEKSAPENIICAALVRGVKREFPKEIYVADQKYIFDFPEGEAEGESVIVQEKIPRRRRGK